LLARTPKYQNSPQKGEKCCRNSKEAYIKRPHPKVEQITAYQRPSTDAILPFEAEQCHLFSPLSSVRLLETKADSYNLVATAKWIYHLPVALFFSSPLANQLLNHQLLQLLTQTN
jgi:hypothetical protein